MSDSVKSANRTYHHLRENGHGIRVNIKRPPIFLKKCLSQEVFYILLQMVRFTFLVS